MSDLPQPTRPRWQPLRTGLVDLFYYDEETFAFRDGHLLLRGNNGTGKSKVLALTLPFLLDGRLAPTRVEPDGDPHKRMEWNLLLGGKYSERLGYAWIEFGRLDESGEPRYFTAGCGLKAVAGRSVQSWFFTTDRRVGGDLALIDGHDRALSRDRLKEALEGSGELFDTAARYRRALDETLFHLGEERYEALINLLIQLRQPQLSKRPDEQALSHALTEALPPLNQAVLADVAEAFRNLDAEREELDSLHEAQVAVEEFLHHYREYARIAARRRAREVRGAQSRHEKSSAALTGKRDEQGSAWAEEKRLEALDRQLRDDLKRARVEAETLRASEEMRDARELKRAEEEAEREIREVESRRGEERHLKGELQSKADRLRRGQGRVAESTARVEAARAELDPAAQAAGLQALNRRVMEPLRLPNGPEPADDALIDEADRLLREETAKRRDAIEHLRQLNRQHREAEAAHDTARDVRQREADEGHRLDEERAEAELAVEASGAALTAAFRGYAEGLQVLHLPDPEAVAAELADWSESLDGVNPAAETVDEAYRVQLRALADERAGVRSRREVLDEERQTWRAERSRLERGEHARPPRPHVRDPAVRAERPGAPLWELIDFRTELPAKRAAAVEAALEASGLLDAWVLPDGGLLAPETWDTVLVPDAPTETHLGTLLRPAVDRDDPRAADVEDAVLERLLAAISWGESDHPAWVTEDGRWRLGPARGAWGKPRAEYIGRGAREAARRRRIAELDELIARQEALIAELDAELKRLSGQSHTADRERAALPGDTELRAAHERVTELIARRRRQQERIDRAEQALAAARERLHEATRSRDEAAGDLGLPTDDTALAERFEGVRDYTAAARAFWPTLREHWQNRAVLAEIARDVAQTRERLEARRLRREEAERSAEAAEVRRDTLRTTVGEAAETVLARLADAEARIAQGDQAIEDNGVDQRTLTGRIERLRADIGHLEGELRQRNEARERAVRALEQFADEGLLGTALPALELPERRPWAADPAVRLARRMEEALVAVDDADSAWERRQRGLMEHVTALQQALSRHGHQASAEPVGELLVVQVVFQSKAQGPDELAGNLEREVTERGRLLNAREQELLENYLIDEVASQLQVMVSGAERMVAAMNEELEKRPTSTGMRLRLQWTPVQEGFDADGVNLPGGFAEVRRRLRQLAEAWTPEDREAVGGFLKQRIDEARADTRGGSLAEVLERALDYRRWHRFVVERWQDGRWRKAYGPASGGERALVVTIPLFAAASSHYSSAAEQAPRLVMLDEAFAGIDDDARAKCMGLLAQFDLDFMMTSEREWGCYPDLPGLAIAQLVRREEFDTVFVSRWNWDGRRRHKEPDPISSELEANPELF
ncbi:TIGR02680 family protein [Thiohalomonas denitrificans]|uniref:TIGR02680 family protein n=1 Tax=Thiohalomonas denitrificans TaxID=415747 RepID=A0A1G5QEN6_9GAMM|nr:TIGR02680 family protein [Thiohalomonas denitrificans]SCZ60066.1 TIGR02680 family protein [Thiohalomonas denitrificans]